MQLFVLAAWVGAAFGSAKGKGKGESGGKKCDCSGEINYRPLPRQNCVLGNGTVDFWTAYDATPIGCTLAPINSADDIEIILAAADAYGVRPPILVGVTKDVETILEQEMVNGPGFQPDNVEGFYNVDGTDVPADSDLWGDGEPYGTNGNGYVETVVVLEDDGLLYDSNYTAGMGMPIYKCCLGESCFKEEPVQPGFGFCSR